MSKTIDNTMIKYRKPTKDRIRVTFYLSGLKRYVDIDPHQDNQVCHDQILRTWQNFVKETQLPSVRELYGMDD